MTDQLSNAVDCYLNNYSNILKNFPPEGQKQTSRYLEVDCHHTRILKKLSYFGNKGEHITSTDGQRMKKMLMDALDLADRKVEITNQIKNMVGENMLKLKMNIDDIPIIKKNQKKNSKKILKWVPNYKKIDSNSVDDALNMDNSKKYSNKNETNKIKSLQKEDNLKSNFQSSEIIVTCSNQNIKKTTKKKTQKRQCTKSKKRNLKSSDNDDDDDDDDEDDDNEIQPTYCVCEEISYGNMVCCDNDLCPIEWFHFDCVSLNKKPKGKWYCPRCRGSSSKTMKPREIFFKELEEYNKRKEEDW